MVFLSDQKMHRLLDEQSLLCSQLSVLPGAGPPSSSPPPPGRTVATQCCMRLGTPPAAEETLRQSPPGSKCLCEGLDMMGFLQRVRHHVNMKGNKYREDDVSTFIVVYNKYSL